MAGGGGFNLGKVMGAVGNAMSGNWTDVAIFAFDTAVDNMSDEAVSHHPAPERLKLLSNYAFKQYRDALPAQPTPLPWAEGNKSKDGVAMTALLAHYAAAENAAAYIADSSQGSADSARSEVTRSSTAPTADHAYTQFVAYEYYDKAGQKPQSEAALTRAANGPEASWEVYSRLIDLHMARNDWAGALRVMDQAVIRFEDSPVLLPKHIQILSGRWRSHQRAQAQDLMPRCKSYDIKEPLRFLQEGGGERADAIFQAPSRDLRWRSQLQDDASGLVEVERLGVLLRRSELRQHVSGARSVKPDPAVRAWRISLAWPWSRASTTMPR